MMSLWAAGKDGFFGAFRLMRRLLALPLVLFVLFEEWGWEPLQRLMGWIAYHPAIAWVEAKISALPPYPSLVVFAVPGAVLFPVKLYALSLIHGGHPVGGAIVIVLAKLVGTALAARLFLLTKPTLMQLAWFAAVYGKWTVWKDAAFTYVRSTFVWRVARVIKRQVKRASKATWLRLKGP
jgi:hypothetical protein